MKDLQTIRREELVKICVDQNINNPIVGPDRYDPLKFDYTKQERKISEKVEYLC